MLQPVLTDNDRKDILKANPGGGRSAGYDMVWDEINSNGKESADGLY